MVLTELAVDKANEILEFAATLVSAPMWRNSKGRDDVQYRPRFCTCRVDTQLLNTHGSAVEDFAGNHLRVGKPLTSYLLQISL